jgi:hypothetical protein
MHMSVVYFSPLSESVACIVGSLFLSSVRGFCKDETQHVSRLFEVERSVDLDHFHGLFLSLLDKHVRLNLNGAVIVSRFNCNQIFP